MAYEANLQSVAGLTASADLSAYQFRFVKVNGSGQVELNTTAGGICDGVLQDKPTAQTHSATVAFSGVSKVVASTSINAGALIASTTVGKAVTATTGQTVLGRALEAAGADGDLISVLLNTNGVAP